MIDAGVRDVCVLDDAHERFSRDRVFAETLTGSRTDLRLEQDGAMYRVFVPESVEPVFTFEADSDELALRRFENVRKQL